MSSLTERIAAEHQYSPAYGGCSCGADYEDRAATYHGERDLHGAHIGEVTEAAVREQIAAQIVEKFPESGPLINMTEYRQGIIDGMNRAARIAGGF